MPFKSDMLENIKALIPHTLVNYGKHLPEALLANFRYGFPGRKLRVIGITGTDGKTTTVNMIYQILRDSGMRVSMISTINAVIAGKKYDTGFHVTSPHSNDLQRLLKLALVSGDEFMVLEVTSHALEQFRVLGINFEIGVITNITHEHLDYHGSFEKYLMAKAKLVKNVKFAVLNRDDPSYDKMASLTRAKIVSFGLDQSAVINLRNYPFRLKIPGNYNILNALAAAAVGQILNVRPQLIKKSLEGFVGLSGRMEKIKNKLGVTIVVDFAHTPNALEQALKSLRSQTEGEIIAVFGCAGARDKAKRPMMGEVSVKLADKVILTDEDPRFEDRHRIIDEIARGALRYGAVESSGDKFLNGNLFREPNRQKAIELAIRMARKGDTVGIFGKGHELSMNYQGKEKPWSDRLAVLKVLRSIDESK